ncbi:MAG: hypothetical protein U1G07_24265 [Verrucomicrobiota bacterium]
MSRRRHSLGLATFAALFLVAYLFWPRQANLRAFEPERVGKMETAMWRQYYEKRYLPLFRNLYAVSRVQYGFSPWDSLRLAWYAARAARQFQPTRSRPEAEQVVPLLERYYGIMRDASLEKFDSAKAARLELEWWQMRREEATPEQYGNVIAQVLAELYHSQSPGLTQSAVRRAEMMQLRDKKSASGLEEGDWSQIEDGLVQSYRLLKAEVQERK